jgi:tripartite-type tricarboxylate transporter receptor subunit TctC
VNPAVYKTLPYETKSLKAVSLLASSPLVLVVNPGVAANSVKELVALAKRKPGELNMATPGNLTGPHLAGALFNWMAGIKVVQVAYRGGPQATTAVIRGESQYYFDTPSGALPYVKSGAVRALAQTFSERVPQLPDLPTVAEEGFPGYEFNSWTGIVAPAGVPADIMARFETALRNAMKNETVRQRLIAAGFVPMGTSSKDFAALIAKDLEMWQKAVPQIGVQVQ